MNTPETKTSEALPLSLPAQRQFHAASGPAIRNSSRLLAMLSRHCGDLIAAVGVGGSAAAERERLHGWLRADYFPWAGGLMLSLSLTARSELAESMAEIGRLDHALTLAEGDQAGTIAAALERVGTRFVTDAVADVSGAA